MERPGDPPPGKKSPEADPRPGAVESGQAPGRPSLWGLPEGSDLPWHRVVNHRGSISLPAGSADHKRQRRLLAKEGLRLRKNGTLELARHLWWPDEDLVPLAVHGKDGQDA